MIKPAKIAKSQNDAANDDDGNNAHETITEIRTKMEAAMAISKDTVQRPPGTLNMDMNLSATAHVP